MGVAQVPIELSIPSFLISNLFDYKKNDKITDNYLSMIMSMMAIYNDAYNNIYSNKLPLYLLEELEAEAKIELDLLQNTIGQTM